MLRDLALGDDVFGLSRGRQHRVNWIHAQWVVFDSAPQFLNYTFTNYCRIRKSISVGKPLQMFVERMSPSLSTYEGVLGWHHRREPGKFFSHAVTPASNECSSIQHADRDREHTTRMYLLFLRSETQLDRGALSMSWKIIGQPEG